MSTPAWRPTSAVEVIVGTPPGGGQDRPARALMRVLEADGLVEVPMKLTNLPGKGGGNAWDAVRSRAGDPHVLSISSAPLLTNNLLGVTDYDHAELTPVATLYAEYLAFVVRTDSSVGNARQFLNALKRDPGALEIAIATARGSTNHIALGQIIRHLGGEPKGLRLRVFESALHAVADVVDGKAAVGVVSAASAVPAMHSGSLRAFAVSAPERMGGCFEDVPTWTELSVPCALGQWRGVIGGPGIAAEHIAFWEAALGVAVQSPVWAGELAQHYWTNTWMGSSKTRDFLDSEREFLARMLRELGLITPS
ncbi:MAG: tripartite tricarboxylate transporter substrate-binding protein [Betaproteobacteria bacterium]